jgi:hypothetical protein
MCADTCTVTLLSEESGGHGVAAEQAGGLGAPDAPARICGASGLVEHAGVMA